MRAMGDNAYTLNKALRMELGLFRSKLEEAAAAETKTAHLGVLAEAVDHLFSAIELIGQLRPSGMDVDSLSEQLRREVVTLVDTQARLIADRADDPDA